MLHSFVVFEPHRETSILAGEPGEAISLGNIVNSEQRPTQNVRKAASPSAIERASWVLISRCLPVSAGLDFSSSANGYKCAMIWNTF